MRDSSNWILLVIGIVCVVIGVSSILSGCSNLDYQPDTGDHNDRFVLECKQGAASVYRDMKTGYAYLIVSGRHAVDVELLEGDYIAPKGEAE